MADRLDDAQALVEHGLRLAELAELGEAPEQERPGKNGGLGVQAVRAEAIEAHAPLEQGDVLAGELRRPGIVAERDIRHGQVETRHDLHRAVSDGRPDVERPAPVVDALGPILPRREHGREEGERHRQPPLIAQRRREVLRALQTVEHPPELGQRPERVPQVELDVDDLLEDLPPLGEVAERRHRLVEPRRSIPVRRPGHRLEPGAPRVVDRLLPCLGLDRVMRQPLDELLPAFPLPALERVDDPGVERPPLRRQEARVRHLVGQRVLERVLELRGRARLVEELRALEAGEPLAQELVGRIQDRLEQEEGEAPPDDRRRLKDALVLGRQPVDAGHEHALDGVRDRRPRCGPSALGHRPGQLLGEEGVALGLGDDHLDGGLVDLGGADHVPGQAQALRGRERLERDLGREGPVHPRRPVSRPVGGDEQDARTRDDIDERPEVLLRGPVDPVEVLHDQHQGPQTREPPRQIAESLEGPRLDHLGTEAARRLPARAGVQELEQVRRHRERIHAGAVECRPQLVPDALRPVGLDHRARRPEQLDDRQTRDRRRVGKAVPFEAEAAGQASAELGDQPRLADARLAGDGDHLPLAPHRRRQPAPQEVQLVVTSDEARAAAGRRLPSLEPIEPERRPAPGRRAEREQVEPPGEEGRPRGAHDDRAGLHALQQRAHRSQDRPLVLRVDQGGVRQAPEEE